MKKRIIYLLLLLVLSGCTKKEKQVIEEENNHVSETSDHKIGVYFSGVDPVEQLIDDFEKSTGGKLSFSRPEFGYYEFLFEDKTEEEIKEIISETNEIEYIKDSELDEEFKEPEIEINTNTDFENEDWTLPEH